MTKELEPHPVGRKQASPLQRNTLARVRGGFLARLATSRFGGQEGQSVAGRKPGKDLVTINQRPSNGGRWGLGGRSFMEKSHVGVHAVGESHHKATHQARQSFGGFVAHGVALHLSVAGRGAIPGPTIVTLHKTHNLTFEGTRRDEAASRPSTSRWASSS